MKSAENASVDPYSARPPKALAKEFGGVTAYTRAGGRTLATPGRDLMVMTSSYTKSWQIRPIGLSGGLAGAICKRHSARMRSSCELCQPSDYDRCAAVTATGPPIRGGYFKHRTVFFLHLTSALHRGRFLTFRGLEEASR
jgi:hypothetical protein